MEEDVGFVYTIGLHNMGKPKFLCAKLLSQFGKMSPCLVEKIGIERG